MPLIDPQVSIGQIVADHPCLGLLFERLGLDYCCGGDRALAEVCAASDLDPGTVAIMLEAFTNITEAASPNVEISGMTMTELADHIEQTHHAHLRRELPRLAKLLDKVVAAHGQRQPRLKELADVFAGFVQEIQPHMMKEEQILFPMIRQLDGADTMPAFHCGSTSNPIRVMEHEHDAAGHALRRMRELTDDYSTPSWACETYRELLSSLAELELVGRRDVGRLIQIDVALLEIGRAHV